MWVLWCSKRVELRLKLFPHSPHVWGRAVAWTLGWAMRVEVQERGLMRWKGVEGWSLVASMVVVTSPSGGLEEPFPSGCSIGKEPSLSPSCSSSMTSIGGGTRSFSTWIRGAGLGRDGHGAMRMDLQDQVMVLGHHNGPPLG